MKTERILIIDDEEEMVENCRRILSIDGYDCLTTTDSVEALELMKHECPALIISDLKMPKIDGLEMVRRSNEINPDIFIIVITAYATIESAVEAVKAGAYDYISKPFSSDQLRTAVKRAMDQKKLADENKFLKAQLRERYGLGNIIGKSDKMQKIYEIILKVSNTDSNVLISGESGTGKELVARSIHLNSGRKDEPFVPVDCAALPQNLLESELFGHEKGAFTGATSKRHGMFEFADGGTVFLDEITELGLDLQTKLLRVLQERQFKPLGGEKYVDVDIRVVAATNRDPEQAVRENKFRDDLYYRLNVIPIQLPPLRERNGDVPLFIDHFLCQSLKESDKSDMRLSKDAIQCMSRYRWPGNVRELKNIIERLVSLVDSEVITVEDLPQNIRDDVMGIYLFDDDRYTSFKEARNKYMETFEKQYLHKLLEENDGNISQAARKAKIDRKTIHRMIAKYNTK